MKDVLVKVDKNGTKYWANYTCPRCGGAGWMDCYRHVDGGRCFDCGGSGVAHKPSIWKEYTEEYAAKLAEQRAKREQKRIAKLTAELPQTKTRWYENNNFNSQGETFLFLGDTYAMKEDIKAAGGSFNGILGWHIDHEVEGYQFLKVTAEEVAYESLHEGWVLSFEVAGNLKDRCKAEYDRLNGVKPSEFVGQVGDKLELELTYLSQATFESTYGTTFVHTFKDANDNVFVWKTGSPLGFEHKNSWEAVQQGTKLSLKGTIKAHSEYRGTK